MVYDGKTTKNLGHMKNIPNFIGSERCHTVWQACQTLTTISIENNQCHLIVGIPWAPIYFILK